MKNTVRNATKRRREVLAAGGRRLELLLQPEAAQALERVQNETGETALDAVSRLLLAELKRLRENA